MSQSYRSLFLITLGLALTLIIWLIAPPSQASAQCGTRTSSCKTCHEIQGKRRVNAKGEWHVQHSFGDFCVFCHGGNTLAKDKTQAHQGMAKPLDDVNAACASCHADDFSTRADKYAKLLGVAVGTGSGTSAPRGPTPLLPFAPKVAGVGDVKPLFDLSAPSPYVGTPASSGDGGATAESTVNWGNVVLAGLALLLLLGGGGYALWNERRLMMGWDKTINARPELKELLPLLAEADPQTVRVITKTLAERGK